MINNNNNNNNNAAFHDGNNSSSSSSSSSSNSNNNNDNNNNNNNNNNLNNLRLTDDFVFGSFGQLNGPTQQPAERPPRRLEHNLEGGPQATVSFGDFPPVLPTSNNRSPGRNNAYEPREPTFQQEFVPLINSLVDITEFQPEDVAEADADIFALAAEKHCTPNLTFLSADLPNSIPPPVVKAISDGSAYPDTLIIRPSQVLNVLRAQAANRRLAAQHTAQRLRQPPTAPTGTINASLPSNLIPSNPAPPPPSVTIVTDEDGLEITVANADLADYNKRDSTKTMIARRLCSSSTLQRIMGRDRSIDAANVHTQFINEVTTVTHLLNCGTLSALSPRQQLIARVLPYKDRIPILTDHKKLACFLGLEQWTVTTFHLGYMVVDASQELAISVAQLQLVTDIILGADANGMFDSALRLASSPDITSGHIPATYIMYCFTLALTMLHAKCREISTDPSDPSGATKLNLTQGRWRPIWDEAVTLLTSVSRQQYMWSANSQGDEIHLSLTAHLKRSPHGATTRPQAGNRPNASNRDQSSRTTSQPTAPNTSYSGPSTLSTLTSIKRTINNTSPSQPSTKKQRGPNTSPTESRLCFFQTAHLLDVLDKDGRPISCRRGDDCRLLHPRSASDIDKPSALATLIAVYDKVRLPAEVKETLKTALQ